MAVLKYWDTGTGAYKILAGLGIPEAPTDGQVYGRQGSTTTWVAALPIAGGTLTGTLTSNLQIFLDNTVASGSRFIAGRTSGSNRWQLHLGNTTAESGSNVGSDLIINRYSDAAAYIDTPLTITRSTGQVKFNVAANAQANFVAIDAVSGVSKAIIGTTAGSTRWQIQLGNGVAESGSNVGSDFGISCFNDAGVLLYSPIQVTRSTGAVTIKGTSTNDSAAAGFVGEVVSSVVASPGVTMTNATGANITSISLTAGDWDVHAEFWFQMGTGGASACLGGVSTTSAVLPGNSIGSARVQDQVTQPASVTLVLGTRATRISIAATTTVYMVAQVNFPSGTQTVYGNIWARRIR